MPTGRLPNFLIVGAAKAATTSLYEMLREHPDIYMSAQKETNFFCDFQEHQFTGPGDEEYVNSRVIRTLAAYRAQFAGATTHSAVGEASPAYLYYHRTVIPRITALLDRPRIVIVLRNPVERAFSGYLHTIRDLRETVSFEEALRLEDKRIDAGWEHLWHHTKLGMYADSVQAYVSTFGRERVLVLLYEDLKEPEEAVQGVQRFLGVAPVPLTGIEIRHNENPPLFESTLLTRMEQRPNHPIRSVFAPLWRVTPQTVRESVRRHIHAKTRLRLSKQTSDLLLEIFREDIGRTSEAIGRDLSAWLR